MTITSQKQSTKNTPYREFEGDVIGKSGVKTIRVDVLTTKMDAKYRKQYKKSKTYAVHDEKNQGNIGDRVLVRETRPISKTKRWRLMKVIKTK